MPTVTLTRIWLHNADDLADYQTHFSQRPDDTRVTPGEVRAYAGGRLRSISTAVRRQTIDITLVDVSATELAELETWSGTLLMYRDPRGRLLWGSYFSLGVSEYRDGSGYDVSLTFHQVTSSAEV